MVTAVQDAGGKLPFHLALVERMRERGYSDHDLAKGVSVPKARVEAWRRGEEVPTRREFGRVCAHLRSMAAHRPTFEQPRESPLARVVVKEAAPPPGTFGPGDYGPDSFGGSDFPDYEVLPPPPPPPRAASFGAALRREREVDGSTQEELGAVLEVHATSVSNWETDTFSPIRTHYEDLLSLYPRLRGEPEPDWKNQEKPGPAPGSARGAQPGGAPQSERGEGATAAVQDDLPPPPDWGDPVGRLLVAFGEVHGGGWTLTASCDGGPGAPFRVAVRRGEEAHEEQGPSVPACCAALLRVLDAELERRIALLEDLWRGLGRAA